MRKIIISLVIAIVAYSAFYISIAFLYAEFNFQLWKESARAFLVIFAPILSSSLIGLYLVGSK